MYNLVSYTSYFNLFMTMIHFLSPPFRVCVCVL